MRTQKSIADEFGVTRGFIGHIKHGRSRSEVPAVSNDEEIFYCQKWAELKEKTLRFLAEWEGPEDDARFLAASAMLKVYRQHEEADHG